MNAEENNNLNINNNNKNHHSDHSKSLNDNDISVRNMKSSIHNGNNCKVNKSNNDKSDDKDGNKNSNSNNKNIMSSILSRIMPPLTAFRNQSVQNSSCAHNPRLECNNNNDNNNNNNSSSNNNNDNINININQLSQQSADPTASSNPNLSSNTIPQFPSLDINSSLTTNATAIFFQHRDSLEDSSDFDNDNDVDKRRRSWRKSFPRSESTPSMEDSGFSSCNCMSDEKDDLSINTSFDYDCEDGISKRNSVNSLHSLRHPFPLTSISARTRARTFSIDSTSSDQSDTNTSSSESSNSKLSSSVPQPHNHKNGLDKNFSKRRTLSSSENSSTSSPGVAKRKSLRLKSRRNASNSKSNGNIDSSNNGSDAINPFTVLEAPQTLQNSESKSDSESEAEDHYDKSKNEDKDNGQINDNSDHNNNRSDMTYKNFSSSVDSVMPFRFADLFGCHGLVTLIACIVYTLFLIFVCGGLALCWTIFKKCINKSDLKDLRENLMESRRRREIVTTSTSDVDGGS